MTTLKKYYSIFFLQILKIFYAIIAVTDKKDKILKNREKVITYDVTVYTNSILADSENKEKAKNLFIMKPSAYLRIKGDTIMKNFFKIIGAVLTLIGAIMVFMGYVYNSMVGQGFFFATFDGPSLIENIPLGIVVVGVGIFTLISGCRKPK